jgi:hypothetical protein
MSEHAGNCGYVLHGGACDCGLWEQSAVMFKHQERIRELEAALHEIADFSEQFIMDDEDGDERMYKVNQIADTALARDAAVTLSLKLGTAEHEFQNFHRLLCKRFGYGHDPVDWRRDQLSLIEHIARLTWRPIETCPSDVCVLLYTPHMHITNLERVEARVYHDSRAGSWHAWATHWMPLPCSPSRPDNLSMATPPSDTSQNRKAE